MTTIVRGFFKHSHGESPALIANAEMMDQFIDAILLEPYENSVAALYVEGRLNDHDLPDHELLIAVSAEDGVGGLWYTGGGDSVVAKGEVSHLEEVVYYYMGNEREFPRDSELPLATVRRAAQEFLGADGRRPGNVEWLPAI